MKTQPSKLLVMFPLPPSFRRQACAFMDQVAKYTKLPPPYRALSPHITFHRPITEVPFETLRGIVESACRRVQPTRMRLDGISHFGDHYVVMPVHVTSELAELWVEMRELLERVAEYRHCELDHDNTLHLTVAGKTSEVFKRAWPRIKRLEVPEFSIPVQYVEIHQKPLEGGSWRRVALFPIYPRLRRHFGEPLKL